MPESKADQISETDRAKARSVSPYKAGFSCKCPNCGEGALYGSLLDVKEACNLCGFDLKAADAGDGAQVFVILILGAISTILGMILYSALGLSIWLIMAILFAVVLGGAVWMLRVFKATLIALQFHHDAHEGKLTGE